MTVILIHNWGRKFKKKADFKPKLKYPSSQVATLEMT